jgi:putative hydrolase of the HAD superfamily
MIRYLLFDLDDTLYPRSVGLWNEISQRMNDYMVARLGVPVEQVNRVRQAYWDRYGTTLRGLYIERQIDPEDFLEYVHDIEIAKYLKADAQLDQVLARLPHPKYVFTNASKAHAERVLSALGVTSHFSNIFDIRFIGYESKPAPAAYRRVLAALNARPEECLMIDDAARNLVPAKALGMRTVLLDGKSSGDPVEGVDQVIATIYEVVQIMR